MRLSEGRSTLAGVLAYAGLSLGSALTFLGLAQWTGGAPPLAVWGGTVWVFILSMIISMPLTTAWGRRRREDGGEQ